MARLFYIHWHKDECLALVQALREAEHVVRFHYDSGADAWTLLKQSPPDALVISLDRLPSHGRRIAAIVTASKKLADLPIVFVGGQPDKVEVGKKEFPHARFCSFDELNKTLAKLKEPAPLALATIDLS